MSTVAIGDRAVLIAGEAGAGKSDLALRLIDRGAILVSDDYTRLRAVNGALVASPPDTIAGKIEVRGLGIVTLPHVAESRVALLVELSGDVERMPERGETRRIAGIDVPMVAIDPQPASAPIKVELALARLTEQA
ncbi:MAG TPA: aldolase [Sphingomonas sp.]|nr:aldolase [Sphingomonas sp.]HEX4693712.1 aldolase [Sphingomonas sp.]